MKKLLRNTAIFTIPLIFLMFVADWFLSSQLRKTREDEYSIWNDLYAGKINSDIVIYGSSRAMVHLDPRMVADSFGVSAYNMGINGHNFWLQYYRHKQLMKYNRKPGFIIHSVDMFTLARRADLFNMEQFLPYMLYNEELKQWLKPYKGYTESDFYLPLIRYYGKYKSVGKALREAVLPKEMKTGPTYRHRGFAPQHLTWNDDLVKAKQKFPDFKADIDPETVTLFDQYLNECLRAGIQIVLVYTPEYIEGQDFVRNRDEVMNTFALYAAKYNIPFLDYSNDPISLSKNYFYNASHLNSEGARKFTGKLIQDMKGTDKIAHALQALHSTDIHQASLVQMDH